jgi:fatty acid-binding protein DegV
LDGNHRLTKAFSSGEKLCVCYVFDRPLWRLTDKKPITVWIFDSKASIQRILEIYEEADSKQISQINLLVHGDREEYSWEQLSDALNNKSNRELSDILERL